MGLVVFSNFSVVIVTLPVLVWKLALKLYYSELVVKSIHTISVAGGEYQHFLLNRIIIVS